MTVQREKQQGIITVQEGETIGYYNGTKVQQDIMTVHEGETIGYYNGTRGRNNRVL